MGRFFGLSSAVLARGSAAGGLAVPLWADGAAEDSAEAGAVAGGAAAVAAVLAALAEDRLAVAVRAGGGNPALVSMSIVLGHGSIAIQEAPEWKRNYCGWSAG